MYKDKTTAPETGTPMWAEVQPIKWKIINWDNLPKSINPNGNGTAETIHVRTEDGIMAGIPFYHVYFGLPLYPEGCKPEYTLWQNSPLRAMLNDYDLQEEIEKGNGNKQYTTDKNYNFKNIGFLQEAFDATITQEKIEKKASKLESKEEGQ